MKPTLIFLHIPKTAGKSFTYILGREYKKAPAFHLYGSIGEVNDFIETLRQMDNETKSRIKLITGHFKFGLHEYLPQPSTYVTFLRDPVDLAISHYYFVRKSTWHFLHTLAQQLSLEDFLKYRFETMENTNSTTRWVSSYYGMLEAQPVSPSSRYEPLPPEALDLALRNLDTRFCFAGITELFDESILLMKELLGWNSIYYVRQNVNKRPLTSDISPQVRRYIEQHHQLDIELYNMMRRKLEAQIRESGVEFQARLNRFRRINGIYRHVVNVYSERPWLKRILAKLR